MARRKLEIFREKFPLKRPFRISRGVKTSADLVRVVIREGDVTGEGECCPYPRYGESVETVCQALEDIRKGIEQGLDRALMLRLFPPGAAMNALDCALWDLEAKISGQSVAEISGFAPPPAFRTMRTVTIDSPCKMAAEAAACPKGATLKIKLDMEDLKGRLDAIRDAAPKSPIVIDANEGWDEEFLKAVMPLLWDYNVVLLEQPLPVGKDQALAELEHKVPVCADEACHGPEDIPGLKGRYDAVNIKLDKTGGLTGAIRLLREAKNQGYQIMLGCMVSSSLSIAPISHLCSHAQFIDLDGPLLLKHDRPGGMKSIPETPDVALNSPWGRP